MGVNVRFRNEDLDGQECTRSVTNVSIRVPSLNFAESRESQGRHNALDNLEVFLSNSLEWRLEWRLTKVTQESLRCSSECLP